MRNPILLALPIALALAFFLGRLSAPDSLAPDGSAAVESASRAPAPSRTDGERLDSIAGVREPEGRSELESSDSFRAASEDRETREDPLFSDALLAHARAGFVEGWAFVRDDDPGERRIEAGIEQFRESVLELPNSIGAQAARELDAQEQLAADAKLGGTFALLEKLESERAGPVFDIALDEETFDGLFQRSTSSTVLDGPSVLRSSVDVEDGATLSLPTGVYMLGNLGRRFGGKYPTDLTIRGAGRDATLIVLWSDWSARTLVRNLTLEDCTIHAYGNYLFDVRREPMSVTVRRTRLVGWTNSGGGQCLFGTNELALRVEDCEIDGSFGKQMVFGRLFDVRTNGLVARFERCRIRATRPFAGVRGQATLAFIDCTFDDILSSSMEVPPNVRVQGGAVRWFQGDDPEILKRDVNELFPDWAERIERLF